MRGLLSAAACLAACPLAVLAAEAGTNGKPEGGYAQVEKFAGCEDFSWVARKIIKAPEFKSEKVRYGIWVLGEGRKSVMVMAWDESGGTGKGYDALYADRNFNGDLSEDGERFFWKNLEPNEKRVNEHYFVENVKEADGERKFHLRFESHGTNDSLGYSSMLVADGPGGYGIHLHHPVGWSNDVASAPIYTLGRGALVPIVNGKVAGESQGTIVAGASASANWKVVTVGDKLANQLHMGYAGGQTFLRVIGPDGKPAEDLPYIGGRC